MVLHLLSSYLPLTACQYNKTSQIQLLRYIRQIILLYTYIKMQHWILSKQFVPWWTIKDKYYSLYLQSWNGSFYERWFLKNTRFNRRCWIKIINLDYLWSCTLLCFIRQYRNIYTLNSSLKNNVGRRIQFYIEIDTQILSNEHQRESKKTRMIIICNFLIVAICLWHKGETKQQ